MTFSDFTNRINWRLVIVHLAATFFIALGAMQFANLSDMHIIQTIDNIGFYEGMKRLSGEDNFELRLMKYTTWTSLSALIGVVISFGVSLAINLGKRVFWFNSFVVLVMSVLLYEIRFFGIEIIEDVFFVLGDLVARFGIEYKYILNGIVLTSLGLYMFFSKRTNNYAFKAGSQSAGVFPLDNEV